MVEFLSPSWLDELDLAVRAVVGPFEPPTVVEIVVRADQAQTDAAEEAEPVPEVRYQLVLDENGGRVVPGTHARPDARFVFDRECAARVAAGKENPQQAMAAGRCHLEGNPGRLSQVADALMLLPQATAALRPDSNDEP